MKGIEGQPEPDDESQKSIIEVTPKEVLRDFERIKTIIDSLERPIASILDDLSPAIERGEYSVIIGDDASGRIPTLIINDVLRSLYEDTNIPPPLVRFIAGSRHAVDTARTTKERSVSDQVERILRDAQKSRADGAVLIVTDTISSGQSLLPLTMALRDIGVEADIASIGLDYANVEGQKDAMQQKLNVRNLVYGVEGTPPIYANNHLGGVTKNAEDLFAMPSVKGYRDLSASDAEEAEQVQNEDDKETLLRWSKQALVDAHAAQQTLNKARALAHQVAERLEKNYRSKHRNGQLPTK